MVAAIVENSAFWARSKPLHAETVQTWSAPAEDEEKPCIESRSAVTRSAIVYLNGLITAVVVEPGA